MAKFIKSFFNTTDRRKSRHEEEEDKTVVPQMDGRRKLSISRSGRMRQANKKRHSLSLDLYSDEIQMTEKRKSTDYTNQKQPLECTKPTTKHQRSQSIELKSPEEEIDSAFEIIDKLTISK